VDSPGSNDSQNNTQEYDPRLDPDRIKVEAMLHGYLPDASHEDRRWFIGAEYKSRSLIHEKGES
jgi:hypothetical protein